MIFLQRQDPFISLFFEVTINNLKVADFSEVTGLGGEIEVEDYKEGGTNEFVHKLPKITKYNNLVLKSGMTDSTYLYDWFEKIANGTVEPRQIVITLKDSEDKALKTWRFKDAFPVKISATDFNSQSNTIMIETVEFVHRGISR